MPTPSPRPFVGPPSPEHRWRVAVLDDDTLIREGLATRMSDLEVVVEAANYADLRADLDLAGQVDVVLLDLKIDAPGEPVGVHGRQAVVELTAAGYRVLLYTNDQRPKVLAACLAAGARGLVHKSEPIDRLRAAIGVVAGGRYLVTTPIAGLAEVVAHRGHLPQLTGQELEVLRARARGETYAQAGARLHLSPRTVETYMGAVMRKFAEYLAGHSVADLERDLGVGEGDLLA